MIFSRSPFLLLLLLLLVAATALAAAAPAYELRINGLERPQDLAGAPFPVDEPILLSWRPSPGGALSPAPSAYKFTVTLFDATTTATTTSPNPSSALVFNTTDRFLDMAAAVAAHPSGSALTTPYHSPPERQGKDCTDSGSSRPGSGECERPREHA